MASREKIAVLVSGGVDSSVALGELVKQDRYDITAFYLKIWLEEEYQFLGDCPWEEDLAYARAVCDRLGVALKVVSLQSEYWDRVVSTAIDELKAGRTPSPDILCNQRVKYGAFLDYFGGEFAKVASGHYAGVKIQGDRAYLTTAKDTVKDQTYFLSFLSQSQLQRCLFPLADFCKAEVRERARALDLATHARRDSQGICFLGKIKYRDFVRAHLGSRPGAIVDRATNKVLGEHDGFWFHTIGQRKGLGLSGGPWFVVDKDIKQNIIYVANQENLTSEARQAFEIDNCHWITEPPVSDLAVKIRHGEKTYRCRIERQGVAARVHLETADPGIASGQYAVFYLANQCLGAGIIS
ncbi:MAG: tRNA 2-thiouridine(34) synthase MnmA [Oligoflexales bacterium]